MTQLRLDFIEFSEQSSIIRRKLQALKKDLATTDIGSELTSTLLPFPETKDESNWEREVADLWAQLEQQFGLEQLFEN